MDGRTNDVGVLQQGAAVTPGEDMPQGSAPADIYAGGIGPEDVRKAYSILQDYKTAKTNLEEQLKQDEKWYQMRHWEVIRAKFDPNAPEPASGWLFNAIINKHADAMDNYPTPNVLPRERGDVGEAKKISSILPFIFEADDFEQTYSDVWYEKLKHGTGAYFVGWNPEAENGLGDVDIHMLDLLDVYWEPGISNIQESRNLFIVSTADRDEIEAEHPECVGKLFSATINDFKYQYDKTVKTEDKVLIIDWYYKIKNANGKTVLHYVKFSGEFIFYASENNKDYRDRGYYDHGLYPVDFDVMFPEKGTPCGFGMIAIAKSSQLYIDKLSANVLEHSLISSKVRYMASASADINENELKDTKNVIVHSALGQLDDKHLRPIVPPDMDTVVYNVLLAKQDELKENAANRDFSNGGTSSGVTAASAIAALQESGNKVSRDQIAASYRSYKRICSMVIELIRQFYTEARDFRITGADGQEDFISYDNSAIQERSIPSPLAGMPEMIYRPVFDLKIKPQKRSPFSQEAQYEKAKELYGLGFFAPTNAQASLIALSMMDFEGKEDIVRQIQQGQTLYNVLQALMQKIAADKAAGGAAAGGTSGTGVDNGTATGERQTIAGAQQQATNANRQSYAQKLAGRS